MSVQKRKCCSCKFFNESPLPGNGWCTHHKRQLSSDVRILVRKGELACRDPWGNDYWTNKEDTAVAAEPGAMAPTAALDRLVAGPGLDDRITSVTASLSGQASSPDMVGAGSRPLSRGTRPDDVIVSMPSMLPEETRSTVGEQRYLVDRDDLNLPAHEDQQERVRIIARGNRDAIVKARERIVLRRGGTEIDDAGTGASVADDPEFTDGGYGHDVRGNVIESDRFADASGAPAPRRTGRRPTEQRAGQTLPSRGYADPTPPVPVQEIGDRNRDSTIVSRRADADRFDSVPDVKPDVALPQLRRFLQTAESNTDEQDGASESSDQQPETTYDRVLQRARAIQTASQKERNARVIRNRPLAGMRFTIVQDSTSAAGRHSLAPATHPLPQSIHDDIDDRDSDIETVHDDSIRKYDPDLRHNLHVEQIEGESDEDVPDDERYGDDTATYERGDDRTFTGPQESWWRGLNLGFRRRHQSYAVGANHSFEVDDWSGDGLMEEPDWTLDDQDDERETADDVERVFSFTSADGGTFASSPSGQLRDSRLAEDELIDYELTDEVLETSFADDTDRVQAASWREDTNPEIRPRHQDAARPRSRPQDSGFALNDRRDMDAFRAALFGDTAEAPEDTRAPRSSHRQTRTHHELPAVPREELPARRDEPEAATPHPVSARQRYVEEPTFDIRNFVEQDEDLLDMRVQIAPDIPRACETCRNFRPSESGERGWCTNDFAFTHRQMVNASDLPCQSSIGCWWLPSDDSWMPSEDIIARENPTPLTDRLIARRQGQDAMDDRAYSEMYVRRM